MARVLYHVNLTTYAGMCPGAIHYYAKVTWRDKDDRRCEHDMEWTVREKCYFCKGEKCEYCDSTGFTEHQTKKYNTRGAAVTATVGWFKENAPRNAVLVVGNPAYCEPQEMVAGPKRVMTAANRIWKKAETYGEKNGFHGAAFDKLYAQWEKIIQS